ncbi:HD-GYP domain-containing protein [Desulfitobacterium sp. THU1]|uniref:HD-GYP domain-containing protein n=1 Tax=Desulfitobacterium sp. THU1 TaxID=3138072 RepID=UPI00311E8411
MKFSLTQKFVLLSLVAFLITGLLISYFVSEHIKNDILNSINETSHFTGVYEVHTPYTDIESHTNSLNRIITGISFFGLFILYFFLFRNVANASQTLIAQNKLLVEQNLSLEHSYTQLDLSYRNTVMALSNAVDARDKYTSGHSQRVSIISSAIGQVMGLDIEILQRLELAARLHDIGKIGVPDEILHKPGKLSEFEQEIIRLHPSIAFSILKDISFLNSILPIILHHHERYDGSGYPAGIKGEAIPFESRIIAVADTYDAMTSDRPYRKGQNHDLAIKEIQRCVGTQFDPSIVEAFMKADFQGIFRSNIKLLQDK